MSDHNAWDSEQVVSWLESISAVFKKYSAKWREEVTGDMLQDLDEDTLENELGVSSGLHRKRILRAVSELVRPVPTSDDSKKRSAEEPKQDSVARAEKKAKDDGVPPADKKEERGAEVTESVPGPSRSVAEGVEVCISFDTTGSMYPCLSQVRRNVKETVQRLLKDIPHIRIALVAHGDYGDEGETYVIKTLNFTSDLQTLIDWVNDVGPTCGYDGEECYELVLRDVQKLAWSPLCTNRSLVLIGDSNPHPLNENNPHGIDWKVEAQSLRDRDIRVYAVHALGYDHSRDFYKALARITNGTYLQLSQFSSVVHFLCSICYRQNDLGQVEAYEREIIRSRAGMDRSMRSLFDSLLGRESSADAERTDGLRPVRDGRFQVLSVDAKTPIKVFAQRQGLVFKTGKGFYQFTKPEHISATKEIVLVKKEDGDMFTGDAARTLLGITDRTSAKKMKIKPSDFGEFDVFVQSSSYNRALVAGTSFLYEVDQDK